MALIECPECGGKVSDQATTCPHCGYPIMDKQKAVDEIGKYILDYKNEINGWKEKLSTRKDGADTARIESTANELFMIYYILLSKGIDVSKPNTLDIHQNAADWKRTNKTGIERINEADVIPFIDDEKGRDLSSLPMEKQEKVRKLLEGRAKGYCEKWKSEAGAEKKTISESKVERVVIKQEGVTKRGGPNCGSLNVEPIHAGRIVSTGVLGLASGTIGKSMRCNACKYMW